VLIWVEAGWASKSFWGYLENIKSHPTGIRGVVSPSRSLVNNNYSNPAAFTHITKKIHKHMQKDFLSHLVSSIVLLIYDGITVG